MLAIGDTVLRGVNFVFLLIALAITGSLAAGHNNSQVSFSVFAAAFAILTSSLYGVLAYFVEACAWPVVLFTFDFMNFVFTFAGATAIAANIGAHSCKNKKYLDSNSITRGSEGRCRKAQASCFFLYIPAFIFIASLVFSGLSMTQGGLFSKRGGKSYA